MTQFTSIQSFPTLRTLQRIWRTESNMKSKSSQSHTLRGACCADADLLFRNSSWTTSCYLEGDYLLYFSSELLALGRWCEGCDPICFTRHETSCLEEWCELPFPWPEARGGSEPAQLEAASFTKTMAQQIQRAGSCGRKQDISGKLLCRNW